MNKISKTVKNIRKILILKIENTKEGVRKNETTKFAKYFK